MRWRNKTWHRVFAFLPERIDCGTWVWLEWYWTRTYGVWGTRTSLTEPKETDDER